MEKQRGIGYCRITWDGGYEKNYITHEFAIVEFDKHGNVSMPHDKAGHVISMEVFYFVDCEKVGFTTVPNMPAKR